MEQLHALTTIQSWLAELAKLREVVCVTADENERLRRVEHQVTGWAKYPEAKVDLVKLEGETWIPLNALVLDIVDTVQGSEQ